MDSIINEICERIISKNEIRESNQFTETFAAAQIEYNTLMNMLNDEQTAAFHEYETAEGKLSKLAERENFKLGVKAGIRPVLEVLGKD